MTSTVLAAHQGGQEAYYASHLREDALANMKVLPPFDYTLGMSPVQDTGLRREKMEKFKW